MSLYSQDVDNLTTMCNDESEMSCIGQKPQYAFGFVLTPVRIWLNIPLSKRFNVHLWLLLERVYRVKGYFAFVIMSLTNA